GGDLSPPRRGSEPAGEDITPAYTSPSLPRGAARAGNGDLRRELRHGRQAADRVAEDRREQQVPADLDRSSGGRGDSDEAPGSVHSPADDARSALGRAR